LQIAVIFRMQNRRVSVCVIEFVRCKAGRTMIDGLVGANGGRPASPAAMAS
jgi:hypothetical protein